MSENATDVAPGARSDTGSLASRHPRLALALLALPSLLIAIDISVLAVAQPRMAADLRPSPAQLLWMNDIYGFMVGGTMITMGAVGDRIGRRRLIVICAAVFAVASAVAAFSVGPGMLILARAVMGLAGAAIMPSSMALIRQIFPDPAQSVAAMGAYMTCFLTGMAVAPLVGGLMLHFWWWGSVFLLGVPVMLLTLVAAPRLLPEYRAAATRPLDLMSAALSLSSILLVVGALKSVVAHGFSWSVLGAAVVGAVLGVVFVRRQHRLSDPLVDLGLLRRPGVSRAMVVLFLTALVMGGTSLFVAFYLQSVQGLTPFRAAICLVPQMLAMIAASNLGPWLGRRLPARRVVLGGLGVMAAGFAVFALLPSGRAGLGTLLAGTVLTTAGIGSAFPFLMNDVISHAPEERAGSAASFAQTANEIGIAMGLVILGSIGTLAYRGGMADAPRAASGTWVDGFELAATRHDDALLQQARHAFVGGFHTVGLTGVVVMAVVLLVRVRPERST